MTSNKRTNIALYNSDFHKSVVHEQEEGLSMIDSIEDLKLYEYPIEDRGKLRLFDLSEKEFITQFERIEDINLVDYPIENLCYYGIFPNSLSSIKIPSSTTTLHVQTSDGLTFLWYKDVRINNFWSKVRYEVECYNFLNYPTECELDSFNHKIRSLNNIDLPKLEIDSQINKLIQEIAESNVNTLAISHIYLSDTDLKILSNLNNIKELSLAYNFNDNYYWLPPNLNSLAIVGSTIQKISQINLKDIKLINLSLEGNCINDLSDIDTLLNSVVFLDLELNRISQFSIKSIPINLETLILKSNLINNSFFEGINKDVENKSVKYLSLSYNQLKVNNWLLKRILETFPNLEHLELEGNITEGIDTSILINDEESSCLERIKTYLNLEDLNNNRNLDDFKSTFNYYGNKNVINIKWTHESLPVDEILAGIDFVFKNYLEKMFNELICCRDGLYCKFPHNETSMLIRGYSSKEKTIEFNLFTSNHVTFEKYFYRYFVEINRIVSLNTHHHILPTASFSEGCNEFKLFYKKIFELDGLINNTPIVYFDDGTPRLLVRQCTIRDLRTIFQDKSTDSIKLINKKYKDIRNIAFVIANNKNIYPYTIDADFSISNNEKGRERYVKQEFYTVSAESEEKKLYVKSLRNKYLGKHCFQEGILNLGENKNGKINIYFNPTYFRKDNEDIICIQPETKINNQNLGRFIKEKKEFNIEIKDCKISGSYV